MDKKNKSETLADKIAGILNTTPANFNPDEDINEETKAKVTELQEEFEDQPSSDEETLSKFRKQNVDLLEEVDTRYAGKRGSRKNLQESDESPDGSDLEQNSEDDNESSDEEDGDESNDDEESDVNLSDKEESDNESSTFEHIKSSNVSEQVEKGLNIRNQLNTWESLLEMRISLQKCLVASNKMPNVEKYKELEDASDVFTTKIGETKQILSSTLGKMLDLQRLLIRNYPETKKLFSGDKKAEGGSDEEIPSDTEEEESEEEVEDDLPKKRARLDDYESEISTIHNAYKSYRNETIQKWNDKTRLAMGKNSGGHSVLNQIEHNLCDHDRLIKRTQVKRSEYTILGEEDVNEVNVDIFDDDDFYHQLLRELIEVKSAGITDPVQLGRQWVKLQNLRSKMKRKIDTRATKGRKIRYAVHSKLVNFMAPIDELGWTNEAKNELSNSLYGKKQFQAVTT